ncbi:MAG TPA: VCBS domain-containing protein, partial [Afipia sp.]
VYDPTHSTELLALNATESLTDTFTYTVHDDHGQTSIATVSVTVAGVNDAPVIDTAQAYTTESFSPTNNPTIYTSTLHDLALSDVDAGSHPLTLTVTAQDGTVAMSGATAGLTLAHSPDSKSMTVTGTLDNLNSALTDANGIVYTSGVTGHVETVSATLSDGHGGIDNLNFVFQQGTPTPGAILEGTSGKDVIISSLGNDTMTGNGGADAFVFSATLGHDTITDFLSGTDHIDLKFNAPFDANSFSSWMDSHAQEIVQNGHINTVLHLDATAAQFGTGVDENTITLLNVNKAALTLNDFIIHPGSIGA